MHRSNRIKSLGLAKADSLLAIKAIVLLIDSLLHLSFEVQSRGSETPPIKIYDCYNVTVIFITIITLKPTIINFYQLFPHLRHEIEKYFRIDVLYYKTMCFFACHSIQYYKRRYCIKYSLFLNSLGSLSTFLMRFINLSNFISFARAL